MHRSIAVAALVALGLCGVAEAQNWTEPKSGIAFPMKRDDMTLLGGGDGERAGSRGWKPHENRPSDCAP